jgi:hypothetical protein
VGFARGLEDEKAAQDKQRENKAKDEEQRLCWWQCFIVDRWMSAAYNRPVVRLFSLSACVHV